MKKYFVALTLSVLSVGALADWLAGIGAGAVVEMLDKSENHAIQLRQDEQQLSQAAIGQRLYLVCTFQWITGLNSSFEIDLAVDFEAGRVNGAISEITKNLIIYKTHDDTSGVVTIHVSRRTGSASFLTEKIGAANGSCVVSQGAKF